MSSTPWQQLAETSRNMADAFIRTGKCRWIDIAFAERWERSLRDLVKSAIYQQVAKGGAMPTLAQLDRFPMVKEDLEYFKGHGQALMDFERDPIMAARAVARRPSRSDRMTGENSGG